MNAINLLEKQHRETDALFSKLEKADVDEKEELFAKLADALAIHATIEEEHFYPASLAAVPEAEELLRSSVEEHLGVKRLIADLLEIDAEDPVFEAKANVLKEQVQHHVEEEESELFPKVQKALDRSALDELGNIMEAAASSMEGTDPRNAIPAQTIAAPPVNPGDKPKRRAA